MREQWCCGGPAAEMGYVDLARKHAEHNVADWRAVGAKRIIAPDPHDFIAFTEDYPRYFGDDYEFEIVLGVELVNDLVKEGRIALTQPVERTVTYHDPCRLNKRKGVHAAPRELLRAVPGIEFRDVDHVTQWSYCSGGGGGLPIEKPEITAEISRRRVGRAQRARGRHADQRVPVVRAPAVGGRGRRRAAAGGDGPVRARRAVGGHRGRRPHARAAPARRRHERRVQERDRRRGPRRAARDHRRRRPRAAQPQLARQPHARPGAVPGPPLGRPHARRRRPPDLHGGGLGDRQARQPPAHPGRAARRRHRARRRRRPAARRHPRRRQAHEQDPRGRPRGPHGHRRDGHQHAQAQRGAQAPRRLLSRRPGLLPVLARRRPHRRRRLVAARRALRPHARERRLDAGRAPDRRDRADRRRRRAQAAQVLDGPQPQAAVHRPPGHARHLHRGDARARAAARDRVRRVLRVRGLRERVGDDRHPRQVGPRHARGRRAVRRVEDRLPAPRRRGLHRAAGVGAGRSSRSRCTAAASRSSPPPRS